MATTDRPGKVTAGRWLATGVLVVLGAFVLSASVGAGSWVLTALGVALIGGGVVLYLVSRFNPGGFTLPRRASSVLIEPVGAQPVPDAAPVGTAQVPATAPAPETPAGPLTTPLTQPGSSSFIELDLTPAGRGGPRGDRFTAGPPRPTRLAGTNELPGQGAHDNEAAESAERSSRPRPRPRPSAAPETGLAEPQGAESTAADTMAPGPVAPGNGAEATAGESTEAARQPGAAARRRPSPRPRPPADDTEPPNPTLAAGLTPYPLTLDPAPNGSRADETGRPSGLPGQRSAPDGDGPRGDAPDSGRPVINGAAPRRPSPPRILRLIPARPAALAMPAADTAGPEQISQAYQKVSPPPGSEAAEPETSAELTVHNLGAAVGFYRDQLGLVQVHIGDKQAILQSGDAYVRLNVDRQRRVWRGALIHVMLEVENVQAAYDALRERGVRFVHEPRRVSRYHDLELWSAAFRDPDGHGLAVIRWDLPPEQPAGD